MNWNKINMGKDLFGLGRSIKTSSWSEAILIWCHLVSPFLALSLYACVWRNLWNIHVGSFQLCNHSLLWHKFGQIQCMHNIICTHKIRYNTADSEKINFASKNIEYYRFELSKQRAMHISKDTKRMKKERKKRKK